MTLAAANAVAWQSDTGDCPGQLPETALRSSCMDPGSFTFDEPAPQIVGGDWQVELPVAAGPATIFYRLMK